MPEAESEPIVCVNGKFSPLSEARISPFDHGLLYGIGVWDTANAFNGYIFKLDEHVDRLFISGKALGIKVRFSKKELKELIIETVRSNNVENAYIKFIITKGVGEPKIDAQCREQTLIVIARPAEPLPNPNRLVGRKAAIVSVRSIPPMCGAEPRIKQLNYLNRYLMMMEGKRHGVDLAIALDINGYVTEGSTANIFIVDKDVFTPLISQVLAGTTRAAVIEIAQELGIRLAEKLLTPYDLYTADEVFLTATGTGFAPIVEIDHKEIGNGKPGPMTIKIYKEYLKMIQKGKHGTPVH